MQIDYLRNWLMDCPYITGPVTLEYLESGADAMGVFSKGNREISRRQDVMGNVWVTSRCSFSLLRRVARHTDDSVAAQWLQDLRMWFQKNNISKAFYLPNLTGVQVDACDGRLQKDTADGMAVYGMTLDVEYVKFYPAK